MNREQAKKLLPIIQAFAEGKTVQYKIEGEWIQTNVPSFNPYLWEYRIKPEPKYLPFENKKECWQEMQKHQPFGWLKDKENKTYVVITEDENDDDDVGLMKISDNSNWSLSGLFDCFTFADGTPFGIKEE